MSRRQARGNNDVVLKSYEYFPDKSRNYTSEYHPMPSDFNFMARALKVARSAIGKDMPIGAVAWLPRTNEVWEAHPTDHITYDRRKHAEDVLLDKIFDSLRAKNPLTTLDLSEFILYTTLRPCARCAQAWSDHHCSTVIYGAKQEDISIIRDRDFDSHLVWKDAGHRITAVEGLLSVEASALLVPENIPPGRN